MAQTLTLEYTCTNSELSEAQSLSIRKQVGGGSQWRTWLVLGVILVGAIGALYFEIRQIVPAAFRNYVFAATLAAIAVFVVWKYQARRRKPTAPTKLEITEDGVKILAGHTQFSSAWSAFSDFFESPAVFVLVDKPKATLLVVPKRVFPSESWQTWFCNLANARPMPMAPEQPAALRMAAPARSGGITLRFRLGFRDYLDRATASWFTWSMVLAVAVGAATLTIYCGAHPPPHAVYSTLQVYFYFVLPFTLVMTAMIVLIATIKPWRSHAKHLVPQEVTLSEETIAITAAGTEGVVPWNTFKYFKETSRSFIIWRSWRSAWVLLPKRAFESERSVEECRTLLMHRLRPSHWFFQ
jgi:uncharacterized membrane protein SirB2